MTQSRALPEVVERRAHENRVDFINGVGVALTPFAYFEVVMNKAFLSLVEDRTGVSVETGLRAAEKLQSVLDERVKGTDAAEVIVKVDRIIDAVRSTVPQSMWGEIIEKLEELEQQHPEAFDVAEDAFEDADEDPFDPTDFIDEDDDDF